MAKTPELEEKVENAEVVETEKEDEGYATRGLTIRDTEVLAHMVLTEKTQKLLKEENVLTLAVKKGAKKSEIKKAVQAFFRVKVDSVNVINYPGKAKRVGRYEGTTSSMRKAYVYVNKAYDLNKAAEEATAEASK